MSHQDASNASPGDTSEPDCVLVSHHHQSSPSTATPTPTPTPSSRSREDHNNFVRSFPSETASTINTAATRPTFNSDAADSAGASAAGGAGAATCGWTAIKLRNNESSSIALHQKPRLGTPGRDSSSVKAEAVAVGRKHLLIGGGEGAERGGGGGRGGPGGSIGSSMVARARGLLSQASSRSQEEEEKEDTSREQEEEEEKTMINGQSFFRKACDMCSKRKRKCSGEQPCSECVHMENRVPNYFCVYSPRQVSGRKKRDRTEIVPYEGINTGQRNAGCQAMDNASDVMVKIKPEDGERAAAEYHVSGEHKEELRCPPAAASRGESLPPRYSKVQITAADGEPAAGPTATERFVAEVSLEEAGRRLRRVQQALSTDSIELRRRREEEYKRLRAELANEKGREERDVYFIEYLEAQLREARQALSAPPEGPSKLSVAPSFSP